MGGSTNARTNGWKDGRVDGWMDQMDAICSVSHSIYDLLKQI